MYLQGNNPVAWCGVEPFWLWWTLSADDWVAIRSPRTKRVNGLSTQLDWLIWQLVVATPPRSCRRHSPTTALSVSPPSVPLFNWGFSVAFAFKLGSPPSGRRDYTFYESSVTLWPFINCGDCLQVLQPSLTNDLVDDFEPLWLCVNNLLKYDSQGE